MMSLIFGLFTRVSGSGPLGPLVSNQWRIWQQMEGDGLHLSSAVPKIHWDPTASAAITVKILKIGTPEIITIIVLQLEQLDFTVQYCVQKMQTE